MRGASESLLLALAVGCSEPVEQHEAPLHSPPAQRPVNAEPINAAPVHGWQWTPPLDFNIEIAEQGLREAATLDHCRAGECTRLMSLPAGARVGALQERPDGAWALLWYATPERQSIIALFDLRALELACTADFSGTLDRPSRLAWAGDAIVHSWSAGTYLHEVAIWNLACEPIETLGAAQVFVADDAKRAILVVDEPRDGSRVELVRLRDDERKQLLRLREDEWIESVHWRADKVELVLGPGERAVSVRH